MCTEVTPLAGDLAAASAFGFGGANGKYIFTVYFQYLDLFLNAISLFPPTLGNRSRAFAKE